MVVLVLLAGLPAVPAAAAEAPRTELRMTGRMVDSVTGEPVRGARLEVEENGYRIVGPIESAEDGTFDVSFLHRPERSIHLRLLGGGPGDDYVRRDLPYETIPASTTERIFGDVPIVHGGVVEGFLVSDLAGGTTAVRQGVSFSSRTGASSFSEVTLRPGVPDHYRAVLPPGEWIVTFAGEYGRFSPLYWRDATTEPEATPIAVTPGSVQTGVSADLQVSGVLAGRVTSQSGEPISGVSVFVLPADDFFPEDVEDTSTDENGEFRVDGVRPGNYVVRFEDRSPQTPPRDRFSPTYLGSTDDRRVTATVVTLTPGTRLEGQDVVMRRLSSISGTLTYDETVLGGRVRAVEVDTGLVYGQTGEGLVGDGTQSYTVRDLPPGRYRVLFPVNGSYIPYGGGTDPASGTIIVIEPGAPQHLRGVDGRWPVGSTPPGPPTLSRSNRVEVRVVSVSGEPVPGLDVYLEDTQNRRRDQWARSGETGTAVFAVESDTSFRVRIVDRSGRYVTEWLGGTGRLEEATVFRGPEEGGALLELAVEADRGGTMSGTIAFPRSEDPLRWRVTVLGLDGRVAATSWGYTGRDAASLDWQSDPILPGEYLVDVELEGYERTRLTTGRVLVEAGADTAGLDVAFAAAPAPTPGPDPTPTPTPDPTPTASPTPPAPAPTSPDPAPTGSAPVVPGPAASAGPAVTPAASDPTAPAPAGSTDPRQGEGEELAATGGTGSPGGALLLALAALAAGWALRLGARHGAVRRRTSGE